jgi:hypothetical protein
MGHGERRFRQGNRDLVTMTDNVTNSDEWPLESWIAVAQSALSDALLCQKATNTDSAIMYLNEVVSYLAPIVREYEATGQRTPCLT